MQCSEKKYPDLFFGLMDSCSDPVFLCEQDFVVHANQAALQFIQRDFSPGVSVDSLLGGVLPVLTEVGLAALSCSGAVRVQPRQSCGRTMGGSLQVFSLNTLSSGRANPLFAVFLRMDVASEWGLPFGDSCLAAILDSVVDGILAVDSGGVVVASNRAASLLFNRQPEEIRGIGICALIPQFVGGRWSSCINASWLVGRSQEMSGRYCDGTLFPLEVTVTRLEEGNGRQFAVVLRDITDRHRSEQAELRYTEALERQIEVRAGELQKLHRRTEGILNSASDAIIGMDINGLITFANLVSGSVLGYAPSSLPGRRADDIFIHGDGPREGRRVLVRAALRRGLFHERMELTLRKSDSTSFVAEYSSRPLDDGVGTVGAVVVLRDITDRKIAEERLGIAAKVLETTAEAIFVCDLLGNILVANPAAATLSGVPPGKLVGMLVADIIFVGDCRGWVTLLDGIQAEEGHCRRETWSRRSDGERFAVRVTASALRLADGQMHRVVLVANDITRRKKDEEKIQYQANYDVLTALPNRNLFNDRLEHMVRVISRTDGSISLMFIDLDGFKSVNDDFGHEVGDILLQEVARRIVSCVRDSDTVARLGGDEFTVILGIVDGREGTARVARRILQVLSAPYSLLYGSRTIRIQDISASVGVVVLSGGMGGDACDLLRKADAAMYRAKQTGKNCFMFWDHADGIDSGCDVVPAGIRV